MITAREITNETGAGLPPFKRLVPDHFVFGGEFPEYGPDGKPTGWMRAAWFDPLDEDAVTSGQVSASHLTRKLTDEEMSALPNRRSDGSVAA